MLPFKKKKQTLRLLFWYLRLFNNTEATYVVLQNLHVQNTHSPKRDSPLFLYGHKDFFSIIWCH